MNSSRIKWISSISVSVSVRVHAGGRLVQQQQTRLGGQGAGDLQAALLAIGQVLGDLQLAILQAEHGQKVLGALGQGALLAAEAPQARDRLQQVIARVGVIGDAHIVQHASGS